MIRVPFFGPLPLPRPPGLTGGLLSVTKWLSTLLAGVCAFGWCAVLLSHAVVDAVAAAKPAGRLGLETHNYAAIDPLPTGSITAIAPLPVRAAPNAAAAEAPPPAAAPTELWRVTTGVNVRAKASKHSGRVATLEAGELVTVSARERNWMLVSAPDGARGWVYGTFLVRTDGEAARTE